MAISVGLRRLRHSDFLSPSVKIRNLNLVDPKQPIGLEFLCHHRTVSNYAFFLVVLFIFFYLFILFFYLQKMMFTIFSSSQNEFVVQFLPYFFDGLIKVIPDQSLFK